MATHSIPRMTEEEYLRLERAAETKSEFIDGEMFPMPGGTLRHSRLAVKCILALSPNENAGNFVVYSSDARIRTPSSGSYVYADVCVVKGLSETFQSAADNLVNPTVIIEVLSPSTEDYDRGTKFRLYREIASLDDYVLIHTDSPLIEHFARQPDASWTFREYRGLESSIRLASIDTVLQLVDLYSGVFDIPELV